MVASARQVDKPEPRTEGDRYRKLFGAMSEGCVVCEAVRNEAGQLVDYWLREANPAFFRRTRGGRQLIDRRLTDLVPNVAAGWLQACDDVLRTGEPARFERWDPMAQRWYDILLTRISDVEFAQIFVDVTDRKRAETFQSDLFAELNHRVKNNLAVVSGLLTLQARNAPQTEVREQLLKAVDRIQSIADVHASLYRQGSTEAVDFGVYLKTLCERIAGALLEDGRVRLEVDAQSAMVALEHAVPLGVVVNELVTNAAKHAYPPPLKGDITVSFRSSGGGLRLVVADHGRGMRDAKVATGGLGMRLVGSMVRQLGGELRCDDTDGVSFEVLLPAELPQEGQGPAQGRLL